MKIQRIDSWLRLIVLSGVLVISNGNAWAAANNCTYNKSVIGLDNAGMGGTGMGGTGVIAKGTGIGGTGIKPEVEQGEMQLAGNVTFSQGTVEAQSKGRSRLLAQGGQICVGETIVTSQSGMVSIKMTDNGWIEVRPQTRLEIRQFVYRGTNKDNSLFALLQGTSRFVTGNIGKLYPQNDIIQTPSAIIGVRGTDHEATVILPGDSRGYPAGTYDKVNQGITFIHTEKGEIDIYPNQVGLAVSTAEIPVLMKETPDFYNTNPALKEGGESSEEGKKIEGLPGIEKGEQAPEQSERGAASSDFNSSNDTTHLESQTMPDLPESPSVPEVPETPPVPELLEAPAVPELPESAAGP